MRIGLVLQPLSEQSLRLAVQIGATDVVAGMPEGDFDELIRLKSRVEASTRPRRTSTRPRRTFDAPSTRLRRDLG